MYHSSEIPGAKPVSDLHARRPSAVPAVDLGHEPPLFREGQDARHDRRTVSLRWLTGTILTGLFGATLIGSAIFVSMDGELTFAQRAEPAAQTTGRVSTSPDKSPRRGDRLFVASDIISAKQSFKTPTTIRIGDREVIKVKPFVRVATNLALGSLGFSDEVPAFNPVKLFAAGGDSGERIPEAETSEGDAEVSFQRRPFPGYLATSDSGLVLSEEQAGAQAMELQKAAAAGQRITLAQHMLSVASAARVQADAVPQAPGISFSTMQVTFVPENVTTRPKSPPEPRQATAGSEEKLVVVKRNETLAGVLRGNGAAPSEARSVETVLQAKLRDSPIREGQRLKLLFGLGPSGAGRSQLLRTIVYEGENPVAIAAVNDRNEFVSVAPPQVETPVSEDDEEEDTGGIRIFDSLYETGFKHEIPRSVIDQLVKVYFYDFDLQRRASGGDSFEVFYAEDEDGGGNPEVLYASLSVSGQVKRYYRFQLGDDGVVDYFDEQGKSNRKFLVRKPIAEGTLRSTFGLRYHPILRYSRMHNGVDWANKVGTPIMAAGDGKVRSAGWDSGYGRRVEIEHLYGFVTTYNHLSGFARGIREGARVRQGQVIGYLGSSGLSTGPHLHYEVMINENLVDPLSIKLPRNRELDNARIAAFQRERERVDELLRKAPGATRVADRVPR
jgi:murein DD-endopeptidase MepM/ murein hydrolase activator NlpD